MAQPPWAGDDDATLLGRTIAELDLRIEESALAPLVDQLHQELAAAGLRFRPFVYLSYDWFTPDGVVGFAAPFYLAHPRLMRLERRQMLEVEGGAREQCLRLLRHETAHALDNAYRLRRKKRFRELFGRAGEPYQDAYTPDPTSRDFVVNLDSWYAQSHPLEDFAETFAVWLRSRWRKRYADWPALDKLKGLDHWMKDIGGTPAPVRCRQRPDVARTIKMTLGEYYQRKKEYYGGDAGPDTAALLNLFSDDPALKGRESAASFLRRHRRELTERVARFTGQHRYSVDQALLDTIRACREGQLRLSKSDAETHLDAVSLLTARTMHFASGGGPHFRR